MTAPFAFRSRSPSLLEKREPFYYLVTQPGFTAISITVTAGGVFYLVFRCPNSRLPFFSRLSLGTILKDIRGTRQ
jgi:hypothetical protein